MLCCGPWSSSLGGQPAHPACPLTVCDAARHGMRPILWDLYSGAMLCPLRFSCCALLLTAAPTLYATALPTQDATIREIERRLSEWSLIPVGHGEGLQVREPQSHANK